MQELLNSDWTGLSLLLNVCQSVGDRECHLWPKHANAEHLSSFCESCIP